MTAPTSANRRLFLPVLGRLQLQVREWSGARPHRTDDVPSEAAQPMTACLTDDEASWITGQIFNVDGGWTIRS